jgi:quercetin dioxygenase-like cupin family protein
MPVGASRRTRHTRRLHIGLAAATGVLAGLAGGNGLAGMTPPDEHRGLNVSALGEIEAASMNEQIGLAGFKLQLREITIEPGGQIATHSHEHRPGLVRMISGSWIEGRSEGETEYSASASGTVIEDAGTVHWFWNRSDEPATAIVCDIVPSG